MIRAAVLSLAVLAMSATSYGADAANPVAKDSAETYTYIVSMTGVT